MTSRTKSFFEQDHKAKQKPVQWRRPNDKQPLSEATANAKPAKPPIPPTSQAKSKLKAFQFVADQAGDSEFPIQNGAEQEKENTRVHESGESEGAHDHSDISTTTASSAPHRVMAVGASSQSAATPQLPHAHTFPCTPGARPSLEDLIGNIDEHAKPAAPAEQSPEEQIGWIPNSSSTLLTPNRRRKRARSSSPSCPNTSSQRQEASAFFISNGTQKENKTPETDPTTSLWQRYTSGNDGAHAFKLPDLSHIAFQGTPRPLETPARSAGMRRWASTGNDWPSSKTKRRRTEAPASIRLWQDEQAVESAKTSKVAAMVERIQETLATQKLVNSASKTDDGQGAPSSSSPLPDVGGVFDAGITSPARPPPMLPQPSALQTSQKLHRQQSTLVQPLKPLVPLASVPLNTNNSLAGVQQSTETLIPPATLHLQSKAPLPAFKRPAINRTQGGSSGRQYPRRPSPPPIAPKSLPIVNENFDEFGDAFDLSVEDLDELVSQVPLEKRSLHDIPQHPNPPPQQQILAVDYGGAPAVSDIVEIPDDDDDEFGGDDLDEDTLAQAEISATQSYRIPHTKRSPRKARIHQGSSLPSSELKTDASRLQRYQVKQVVDGEFTDDTGRRRPERVLLAEDERTLKVAAITLRGSWTATSVSPGAIVHVSRLRSTTRTHETTPTPAGQIVVDDQESSPLLIIHPDHMFSATTVADSFDCTRKAVLQDRIKATGETSKAMVYGKILHEVFQQALSTNQWDTPFLSDLVDSTVQSHVEGLWELGMMDTVLATEEITAKMGELSAWAEKFVAAEPSETSLVDDRGGEKVWMSISKLIAIEEHIWSPRYGLKGNIDATVQSTVIDHPNEAAKRLIAPFEVKTGKTTQSSAHQAQTALYTLLMSDRYDAKVAAGILYYLESSAMSRIAPPVREVRQLIQQRNRLAIYIHHSKNPKQQGEETQPLTQQTQDIEESGLPGLRKNPNVCGRCYARQSCFAFHALSENGSAKSAGMIDDSKKNYSLLWQEAVGHLARSVKSASEVDALKSWFVKWDRLLTFEEKETSRQRKELWTMSSSEREATGRCFGNVVLAQDLTSSTNAVTQSVTDGIEGSGGKINRYAYVFRRDRPSQGTSFAEGTQLTIGEPVVVSTEQGQWALSNGYIIAATKHDITVAVDRRLGNARQRLSGFAEADNQMLRGTTTIGNRDATPAPASTGERMLYRLDKDEFSNGLALVRNNLVTLMSSHPIHSKLREQVVFGAKPSFARSSQLPTLPRSQLGDMNEDQRAAVSKVLSAEDYALILGMPGTGKTTTIAHVIRALLAENKTILLTSYTHTAVDNILLKIRDIAPPNSILRFGLPAKINAEVQTFCQLAATPRKTIDEIEAVYMGCRIVATTCMGTNHAIFNRRAFDVCIVDEASQITLPISLGPLLHARKFVLVGDHYQLPPLVQNKAALEGGLDVSLFRQLSEVHPEAVATLGKQYRMCEDIMTLSNTLIYDGQLRCGSDDVAQRTLSIAADRSLQAFHSQSSLVQRCQGHCWLGEMVKPERKVVFASTDCLQDRALESLASGKSITNQLEATLSAQLVLALLALGVPAKEIGVITLYRSQLALMRQLLKLAGIGHEVEIDSADRFQGRDKECIILSMVRSNEAGIVGDLLKDWRRVNVALTRARSKLLVLGSRRTLINNELLAKFVSLVDERRWAIDLPHAADTCHTFDFSSQVAASLVPHVTPTPAKQARNRSDDSPKAAKSSTPTRLKVLRPSASAGNRSPIKTGSQSKPIKLPGKIMKGGRKGASSMKAQVAIEIFEDLTASPI